ncbi:MAG: molybdenum cofactor guanylyltransferase [Ilumatobacteraceae bacterium]
MPAGAVLCGGRSSRMGRDKALVEIDGVPMVARVAAALRGSGCDPVVAIGGDRAALASLGLDVILDDHPGEGPLGGILTALTGIEVPADGTVVVVSCDVPWLTAEAVHAVAAGRGGHDVAVAVGTRREPLCAAWRSPPPPSLAAALAGGERAVHRAVALLDAVDVPVDPAVLGDVDSPADLPGRAADG